MTTAASVTLHTYPTLLPSAREMAAMDAATIAAGVSSGELMKKAGLAACDVLIRIYPVVLDGNRSTLILCGPGNNGGDGLVIARELKRLGGQPCVVLAGSGRYSKECLARIQEYQADDGELYVFGEGSPQLEIDIPVVDSHELSNNLRSSKVLVDALLGTGQENSPRGNVKMLAAMVEEVGRDCCCVAIDIPTGVNGTTGEVYEPVIRSDHTITIELIKRGMVQYPALDVVGKIHFVLIGIDSSAGARYSLLNSSSIPQLPDRSKFGHKFSFGHTLVVGGCREMPGAPQLSGFAALRSGSGLVSIASGAGAAFEAGCPAEILHLGIESAGNLCREHVDLICKQLDSYSSIVLGPGLGQASGVIDFVGSLLEELRESQVQLVVDADGLNHIAAQGWDFAGFKRGPIITPHPGEAARLLEQTSAEIQTDRYGAVARLLDRIKAGTVVLKGPGTVILSDSGGRVNLTGSSLLATAGSGDVLSGLIAALCNQGLGAFHAACAGVYLHGLAGESAGEKTGGTIIASDIIAELPALISTLRTL